MLYVISYQIFLVFFILVMSLPPHISAKVKDIPLDPLALANDL